MAFVNTENEPVWGGKAQITEDRSEVEARQQIVDNTVEKLRRNGFEGELSIDDFKWQSQADWIQGYVLSSQVGME